MFVYKKQTNIQQTWKTSYQSWSMQNLDQAKEPP